MEESAVRNKVTSQTEHYQSLLGHDTQWGAAFLITMPGTPTFSGVRKPQPQKFWHCLKLQN